MQTLDIVNLIEKNPITKLTKPYQSRLINKIKARFTTDEQQLFLASFYCYLNYKKDDYPVDLDNVWEWMGFSEKSKAKRTLAKNFAEPEDYKISEENKNQEKHGGHNKEQILMTIKTFKKLCMKANTKKSNEIHDYYLKLEEILHETLDEESKEPLRL